MKKLLLYIKQIFFKFLDWTIKRLQNIQFKYSKKSKSNLGYSSLSPTDNYLSSFIDKEEDENKNKDHYSEALLWALENRSEENIRNIALSGPYGCGKSSILRTFQKNYKGSKLKFLNISLATFEDEYKKKNKPPIDKNELLKLIEVSILEQIFFHEKDSKVPDSKLKKIKRHKRVYLILVALYCLLFVTSLFNYFNPYFIQSLFKDHPFSSMVCDILHYTTIAIIAIGLFLFIYKSIRIVSNLTINKLKLQSTEIGFEKDKKSILNHHIDEILYFFSVAPYNVVIIEDLDRFQETGIFTKLREINHLLNNSKKTRHKEIVFVYAISDDMFSDNKERPKFFDFIIPIIPYINSSNSGAMILQKKDKHQYNLTTSFIESISFFIDDMRLLHNICNEFFLYKQKIDGLIEDKLFAIITYKNMYPNDFVNLSYNKGILYDTLNSKSNYIHQEISRLDNQIAELKSEIKTLESLSVKNIKELRLFYILRTIEKLDKYNSFVINSNNITVNQLTEDENFAYLINKQLQYNKLTYNRNYGREELHIGSVNVEFSEIENKVDAEKTYKQKEQEIIDYQDGKIVSLKNKVQELEKQKIKTRGLKIVELVRANVDFSFNIKLNKSDENNAQKDIINILVRNGYIAEDYMDYISLFHEGSITYSDHKFYLSIRNQSILEFDYPLNKIENLIEKINLVDFGTEYVLNYDLVDFILKRPIYYETQIESIFDKLKDESNISVHFINGFIDETENFGEFIKILCNHWTNIWNNTTSNDIITDENKVDLFESIITYAEISAIKSISRQSTFKQSIIGNSHFFFNCTDDYDKLKTLIKELDVIFTTINFDDTPDELLRFIYENNYYQINKEMVSSLIKKFGTFNQVTFDNSNYASINESDCKYLIEYINQNINKYIESIYLKIDSNINETENSFINLLNDIAITTTNKIAIIKKVNTKITNLSSISDNELYTIILSENNVVPLWENLFLIYNKEVDTINPTIITFINNHENAEGLANIELPKEDKEGEDFNEIFWKKLISQNDIDDESYKLITDSVQHWWYSDLKLSNLSEEKIKLLINSRTIAPTTDGFMSVKEISDELALMLIEKNKKDFINIVNKLSLESNDLVLILNSKILSNSEKNIFLKSCSEDIITEKIENLKTICDILITDTNFKVDDTILKKILLNKNISISNRIKLFNIYPLDDSIDIFLTNLGGKYAEINDTHKRPTFEDNSYNQKLLAILKGNRYKKISTISPTKNGLRIFRFVFN